MINKEELPTQQTAFSAHSSAFSDVDASDKNNQAQSLSTDRSYKKTAFVAIIVGLVFIFIGYRMLPAESNFVVDEFIELPEDFVFESVDTSVYAKIQSLKKQLEETDPTRTTIGLPPVDFNINFQDRGAKP